MLAGWFVIAAFAAEPSAPTGRIDAVVVFPDRAEVTRVVEVPLVAGSNAITFRDLPPTIDEHTLAAAGDGVAGAKLTGIDVVSRELVEDRRARIVALEARIEQLADRVRERDDRVRAAQIELRFLEELRAAAAAQASAELLYADRTVEHARGIADLLRVRLPEVQAAARGAEIERRELQAQLDAARRELDTTRGGGQWARRDVTVTIDSPAAGEARVRLSYVLPGASWTPAYDVRASPDTGKADLTLHALVTQTSGEDWSEVSLVLSTARPALGVSPPALEPWWLTGGYTLVDAKPSSRAAAAPAAAPADEAYAEEAPPEAEPMAVAVATVETRAVATTFQVPNRSTVPGDGTRRKVRVADVPLDVELIHVAVPRLDASAWLVGRTTWTAAWPLLPGEVAAFTDGAFVGTSWLDLVGTGGELELPLGRDDGVSVEHTVVSDTTSRGDWLGRRTTERRWTWTVTNRRQVPVTVELRDVVPQSTEARWKVVPLADEPTRIEAGVWTYRRPLAPGAEATENFGWRVRYPRRAPPGGL